MENKSNTKSLGLPILFAAVILSASMIYLGSQYQSSAVEDNRKQTEEVIQSFLKQDDFLTVEIEKGIQNFIRKQQEPQQQPAQNQQGGMQNMHKEQNRKAREAAEQATVIHQFAKATDHVYGNPDAEISLIEYASLGCPSCGEFYGTAKKLVDSSDGKVNWIYRHFPLSSSVSEEARQEAEISICMSELGGNDVFWEFNEKAYQATPEGAKKPELKQLYGIAKKMGIGEQAIQGCLDKGTANSRVKQDIDEGMKVGIQSFPGNILVNNVTKELSLLNGVGEAKILQIEIDRLLFQKDKSLQQQVKLGEKLFATNCAACHGDQAAGGKVIGDAQAPALNGSAHGWHHPDYDHFSKIKNGGKGSIMPAWKDTMSDEEIWAVMRYFQSFWQDDMLRASRG